MRAARSLAFGVLAILATTGTTLRANAQDAPAPGSGPAAPPAVGAPAVPPAPPPKPAPPPTPEQAADAVLAAVAAKDGAALKTLAAKDDPDPWLVADELIRRAQHDAADAFAKAAPRVDTEALPAYVASRRGKADDPARRERLAKASEALAAERPAIALRALSTADPGDDVVDVRLELLRGAALVGLDRVADAAEAFRGAADRAERFGWLRCAMDVLADVGNLELDRSAMEVAIDAGTRAAALAQRLGDPQALVFALTTLGLNQLSAGAPTAALRTLERALAAVQEDPAMEPDPGLFAALGLAHTALRDWPRAVLAYERAIPGYDARGDREEVGMLSGNLARAHLELLQFEDALAASRRARSVQETLGDHAATAESIRLTGLAEAGLGRCADALATLRRAFAMLESMGDRRGAATTLANLADVHAQLGDFGTALTLSARALRAQEEVGDRQNAARTLNSIGLMHHGLGNLSLALTFHERALAANEALGDAVGAATSLNNIGNVLGALGDGARALAAYERAVAIFDASRNEWRSVAVLGNIGATLRRLGDAPRALDVLERALRGAQAAGARRVAANAMDEIAAVHRWRGDRATALALHRRALAEHESLKDFAGVARAWSGIGHVHLDSGDFAQALAAFERSLDARRAWGNKVGVAVAHTNIGRVHAARGDHARALASAREAVSSRSDAVEGLSDEEGSGARAPVAFAYDLGAKAASALLDERAFFFFAESGRSGALLEGLSAREALWSATVPPELRAEETTARTVEARAASALRRALDGGDLATTRARRAELEAARERVAAVVSRIQREAKAGAAIVYPQASTLDEVRAALDAGDALVLYALFEQDAAALVVEPSGARIVTLGPRAPIDAAAAALAEALADGESDPAAAITTLAGLVGKPLALREGTKRVLVSPSGALSYVPFAALWPDRTVAYVPSGTTYRLLREDEASRGEGVLALGDPDYETKVDERALAVNRGPAGRLVRLPATRDEALAIGTKTLLGADATEAGLRQALAERKRWRALHLACHGLVNTERPALSSLAITAAGDDDGFLTCLDVFRLKVPSDLAVLSACETGKGKIVGGEGIVGLTRAFMYAGSPRVICSLWKVDDAATASLMKKFYELWNPKDGKPGLPTAEALRQAQEHVRSQEKWKHPYYWAAWVLWGLPS